MKKTKKHSRINLYPANLKWHQLWCRNLRVPFEKILVYKNLLIGLQTYLIGSCIFLVIGGFMIFLVGLYILIIGKHLNESLIMLFLGGFLTWLGFILIKKEINKRRIRFY